MTYKAKDKATTKATTEAGLAVKNKGAFPLKINHVEIAAGGDYALTDNDQANEVLMKKVNHMLEIGVLVNVNS